MYAVELRVSPKYFQSLVQLLKRGRLTSRKIDAFHDHSVSSGKMHILSYTQIVDCIQDKDKSMKTQRTYNMQWLAKILEDISQKTFMCYKKYCGISLAM